MIPQSELHKGLKCAACFIDPSLPGLHVVHFNFKTPDNFELIATDGHRLVIIEYSAPHSCPPGTRVSVPRPMVQDVLKMFPAEADTEVTLAYWESKLLFTNGADTHMVQGPPPGDYPDIADITSGLELIADVAVVNPVLLVKIIKECTPVIASKRTESPCLTVFNHGNEAPVRLHFKVNPEIETISDISAYLMPLKVDGRIT